MRFDYLAPRPPRQGRRGTGQVRHLPPRYDEQTTGDGVQEGCRGGCRRLSRGEDPETRASLRRWPTRPASPATWTREDKGRERPHGLRGLPRTRKARAGEGQQSSWTTSAAKLVDSQPELELDPRPGGQAGQVRFDHLGHEAHGARSAPPATTSRCRACEHCHTLTGDKKGGDVTLEAGATTTPAPSSSCVGCHRAGRRSTRTAPAATAHAARQPHEASCKTCHAALPVNREGKLSLPACMPGSYPAAPELAALPAQRRRPSPRR